MSDSTDFKEGDPVLYTRLANRRLTDVSASFIRYQEIGDPPRRRRMAVIKVGDTGRVVQVATTSISATRP